MWDRFRATLGGSSRLVAIQIVHGLSAEVQVFARLAAGRRFDLAILAHDWPGDRQTAARLEQETGAHVQRFDFGWRPRGGRSAIASAASWARLAARLPPLIARARQLRPDAIYSSQQRWDCLAASVVARALGVPQIVHLHYIVGPWLGGLVLRRLRRARRVIAISDFVLENAAAHGVPRERLRRVHNPARSWERAPAAEVARLRAELGAGPGEVLAGFVARLTAFKGQRETLYAFAQVRNPAARLAIVGEGPILGELQQLARELGIERRVVFTGPRADVPALLSAFDLFVHPSQDEPFGMAVLEAQVAGLPVLALAEGGAPEIVEPGVTGLLVPRGDAAALAQGLARLFAEPETRARMGRAAQDRAPALFDPARCAEAFSQAVLEVSGSSR